MKVLIATGSSKQTKTKFNWCDPNELVMDSSKYFIGFDTRKACTHAMVAEVNMTKSEFIIAYEKSLCFALHRGSYIAGPMDLRIIESILSVADSFEVGDILKISGHNRPISKVG